MRNPEPPKTVLDTIAMLNGTTLTPTFAARLINMHHKPMTRQPKNVEYSPSLPKEPMIPTKHLELLLMATLSNVMSTTTIPCKTNAVATVCHSMLPLASAIMGLCQIDQSIGQTCTSKRQS
jgi:hypothetical protein